MSYSLGLTSIFSGSAATPQNRWTAANFYDKAIFCCNSARLQFWPGFNQCLEVPGIDPALRFNGVTVLSGHVIVWHDNVLKWCTADDYSSWIPIGETVSNARFTLNGNVTQGVPGDQVTMSVNEPCDMLVQDQFIRIDFFLQTNFFQIVSVDKVSKVIVATVLNLTGITPAMTVFPSGAIMTTIPANDAGELINSGDRINGPILHVVPMGDSAILFKARSIQMIELTDGPSGRTLFNTHIVVSDEGLLGKYSWCRSTNEIIYFLGNRELYAYSGGLDMQPVATQQTKQMYAELDLANADAIILRHVEANNEIWVVYPVVGQANGPRRILIYNYRWNTCSLDDYDETTDGAVTAVGEWDYQVPIIWSTQSEEWADAEGSWYDFQTRGSLNRRTVLALNPSGGNPTLNVYGGIFDRAGTAILSDCQTQDFDFKDNYSFKYINTVFLSLEVLQALVPGPFKLIVQLGARDNLDSPIRWSAPWPVEASGFGGIARQANLRASGRYIRVRFSSQQKGVQWRISSFRILGRMGNSY